jgi:DNA polymerase-1
MQVGKRGLAVVPEFWTPADYRAHLLKPLGEVTLAMERTGCPVDLVKLRGTADRAAREETGILADLRAWAGREVNWASWQQLGAFLHTDETGLRLDPSPYWKKGEVEEGEIKTDDRALEWLAGHNPAHRAQINSIRQLRRWQRTRNYAEDWLDKAIRHPDGTARLHPSFGLGSDHDTRPGAVTGRFGVKNPPLNQVPRPGKGPAGELRAAFIPPPGCKHIVVDFSQLEVVILAHLCAVLFGEALLAARLATGDDLHSMTARYVFGELAGDPMVAATSLASFKEDPRLKDLRNLIKAIRYGLNYGKGEVGFATSVFLPSGEPMGRELARRLIDGLFAFDPEIPRYQQFIRDWITERASIQSLFGRMCFLPHAKARKQGDRNRAWRQALNYPMQAGGQEVMALALLGIFGDPYLAERGFVLSLVVHDEVVGWAPEDTAEACLARVKQLMCEAVELKAPLLAEGHTGASWADAK